MTRGTPTRSAAMYPYFSRYVFDRSDIPIFYAGETVDQVALSAWYRAHRPDGVIYADHAWHDAALAAFFKNQRIVAPRDLGLAVLDAAVHSEGISVVRQRGEQMGISVVDRLVSRLQHGESGFTEVPKIEKVEGEWMEGGTLRARIWTG